MSGERGGCHPLPAWPVARLAAGAAPAWSTLGGGGLRPLLAKPPGTCGCSPSAALSPSPEPTCGNRPSPSGLAALGPCGESDWRPGRPRVQLCLPHQRRSCTRPRRSSSLPRVGGACPGSCRSKPLSRCSSPDRMGEITASSVPWGSFWGWGCFWLWSGLYQQSPTEARSACGAAWTGQAEGDSSRHGCCFSFSAAPGCVFALLAVPPGPLGELGLGHSLVLA